MHAKNKEALETIDAMVFSGDTLHFCDARKEFKEYLDRWLTAVEEIEGIATETLCTMEDDIDDDDDEPTDPSTDALNETELDRS